MSFSQFSKVTPGRIALAYVIVASLWVAFSDVLVTHSSLPQALLTIKGVAFVWVTGLLLYLTIRRLVQAVRESSREREETDRLCRAVVEASGEGICLLDESGRISFCNARLAAMLGRSQDQLQGKDLQTFIHEAEWLQNGNLSRRKQETHEFRLRTESGQNVWAIVSFAPVFHAGGSYRGYLAMFLDVTECRLLQEELGHSQKLEALGRFAGGIAHDFNNLLSIVTGYAALLAKTPGQDGDQRNAIREILQASDRGASLVRQLLAFSRKQNQAAEIVDVGESVRRFGELLPRIVGEDITVTIETEQSTGCVRAGAGQIEQILMNLAANARDAMPDGGALAIATRNVENVDLPQGSRLGTYVSIQVRDTGTGIDPYVKSRIFEPFFTTKPQGTGTGLGLSTVYGIIAQSGGCITCDSTVGVGTIFTVYLPLTQKAASEESVHQGQPCAVWGTETVLLVEDEPALRALTAHILSSHGYRVLQAGNGAEAVRIVEDVQKSFDLLLTDVVMPGMNGVELADKISHMCPDVCIAFMSGYAEVPGRIPETACVIPKPMPPDALLLRLRAILDARPRGHRVA